MSGASVMLAELAIEAGIPNGVLNIVHGTNVRVKFDIFFYCRSIIVSCNPMIVSISCNTDQFLFPLLNFELGRTLSMLSVMMMI